MNRELNTSPRMERMVRMRDQVGDALGVSHW
jgi:hypothetical protein